jgi:hypothetical protein
MHRRELRQRARNHCFVRSGGTFNRHCWPETALIVFICCEFRRQLEARSLVLYFLSDRTT